MVEAGVQLALACLAHLIPLLWGGGQRPIDRGCQRVRAGWFAGESGDPLGYLLGQAASGGGDDRRGAVHDLTAARTHDLINALTSANVMTFADKAYQGAGGSVRTPFKRRRYRPRLSRRKKTVNRHHAKTRAVG